MIKLIKIFKESLNEIGDLNKSTIYPFKIGHITFEDYQTKQFPEQCFYEFFDGSYNYEVKLVLNKGSYDILFLTKEAYYNVINSNHPLSIVATVAKIIMDFIKRFPKTVDHYAFHYSGIDKGADKWDDETKRSKIYNLFLQKNLPSNFEFIKSGSSMTFKKKGVELDPDFDPKKIHYSKLDKVKMKLNEIMDSPYSYRSIGTDYTEGVIFANYSFTTDSKLTYNVYLDYDNNEDLLVVNFDTEEKGYNLVNDNKEVFKVGSTIIKIIKDFANKQSFSTIAFSTSMLDKDGNDSLDAAESRERLYLKLIDRAFPGINVEFSTDNHYGEDDNDDVID